jgi:ABC-type bacteriocin/lantibiotic exporter with double-glycine peptidase domain
LFKLARSKAPSLPFFSFSIKNKVTIVKSTESTLMWILSDFEAKVEKVPSGFCIVTVLALCFLYVGRRSWRMINRLSGNPAVGSHLETVASTSYISEEHPTNTAAKGLGRAGNSGWEYLKGYTGIPFPFLSRAWKYIKGYKIFFPYMWPSDSRYLQVMAMVCFCLTGCQRAINALLPYQIANVIETLSPSSELPRFHMLKYFIYTRLQAEGLLGSLKSFCWSEVREYSSMKLSIAAFEHVHSLDLDFHLGKRNGEIISVLRNSDSVINFMELVMLRILPPVCDLIIAMRSLWLYFDPYSALLLLLLALGSLQLTAFLVPRKAKLHYQMVEALTEENAMK